MRLDQNEATVRLVAEAQLLRAPDWSDFAVERLLSGTIFEESSTGRLPSVDAWVQVDGVMGDGRLLADTRTDANGRFVVCGLEGKPTFPMRSLSPSRETSSGTPRFPTEGGGPLDVELRVCPTGRPILAGVWCHPDEIADARARRMRARAADVR